MMEWWEALELVWLIGVPLMLALVGIGATLRDVRRGLKHSESDSRRNCIHHGLIFDKLGISREEVSKAESKAGIGPKGQI